MLSYLYESVHGLPQPRMLMGADGTMRVPDGVKFFTLEQAKKQWPQLDSDYLTSLWANTLSEFLPPDALNDEVPFAAAGVSIESVSPEVSARPTTTVARRLLGADVSAAVREKYKDFDDIQFAEIVAQHEMLGIDLRGNLLIPQKQPDPDTGRLSLVFIMTAPAFLIAAHGSKEFDGFNPPEFAGREGVWKEHWAEDAHPYKARCVVKRRGVEYCWPIYWRDVAQYLPPKQGQTGPQLTHFWAERWTNQFGKCAMVASLRKAFPDRLQRIFLREELSTSSRSTSQGQPSRPAYDPDSQLPTNEDDYSQMPAAMR